jgi:hypothetical protein
MMAIRGKYQDRVTSDVTVFVPNFTKIGLFICFTLKSVVEPEDGLTGDARSCLMELLKNGVRSLESHLETAICNV